MILGMPSGPTAVADGTSMHFPHWVERSTEDVQDGVEIELPEKEIRGMIDDGCGEADMCETLGEYLGDSGVHETVVVAYRRIDGFVYLVQIAEPSA